MSSDRKRLYIISASILAILALILFAPMGTSRILAAVLLVPAAILCGTQIKKRVALSINSKQVLLLISVIGLLYFVFYYVSAVYFGFVKTGYGLKIDIILEYIIPVAVASICLEHIRHVLCAQKDKWVKLFVYLIALITDVVLCASIPAITNMATFMDVVAMTVFPGILYNLLYNYLTVRYGPWPMVVYKAFTLWVFYLIPYGSAISNSLVAFANILLAIAIYVFIDSLYEKKRRYARGNRSLFYRACSGALTVIIIVLMSGIVMLVSNQFRYGAYVIATESMTGELNVGDVAIYESYDKQPLVEGQVIVFAQGNSMVVHRVVDIKIINGVARYYTQGDANEDLDAGYITDADIIGLVNLKLPYFGYPTLWIRSLFHHR